LRRGGATLGRAMSVSLDAAFPQREDGESGSTTWRLT
jgi:hypothetical protein